MYSASKSARVSRRSLQIALPAILLFTAACASTPVPTASLQAAQQSIVNAERVEAGTHAPLEMRDARTKLAAAQRSVEMKDMLIAGRLADEARADADLAVARTSAVTAAAVNADMKRSNATLVDEMQRKTGDSR